MCRTNALQLEMVSSYITNLKKIDLARINADDNKFITQQYPNFQVPNEKFAVELLFICLCAKADHVSYIQRF